jgi:hypothetical protein
MKRISEEMRRDLSKALGVALERLAQGAEQRFREGNKSLLLETLFIHIGLDLPIPKWAKDAFLNACISQPEHWDDVFGRPEGPQKKEELLAYFEGIRLRAQGRPIGNDGFFDDLGEKLGKSGGTAKRRYYSKAKETFDKVFAIKRWLGFPDEVAGLSLEEKAEHRDLVFGAFLVSLLDELRDQNKETSQNSAKD